MSDNTISLPNDEYHPISNHLKEALERYLNLGLQPGGFLTSVLCNDLAGAFGRADSSNSANLKNIVGYVYNNIPSISWGSPEKVEAYLAQIRAQAA